MKRHWSHLGSSSSLSFTLRHKHFIQDAKRLMGCKYTVQDGFPTMSSASLTSVPVSEFQHGRAVSWLDWKIELSVTVCANRPRLYSAITIPEYMEAWMCLPGMDSRGDIAVLGIATGFRICTSAALEAAIVANYTLSRPSKVIFTWKNQRFANMREGVVDIRLVEESMWTRLELKHFGTGHRDEYRWHRGLWQRSLYRLTQLFHSCIL